MKRKNTEDNLVAKLMKNLDTFRLSTIRGLSLSVAIAGGLLLSPVLTQQSWAQEEDPGELARESLELMMKSLSLVIDAIPQYEMPVINDNGDIIIRRKQKDDWEDLEETPETEADEEDSKKI